MEATEFAGVAILGLRSAAPPDIVLRMEPIKYRGRTLTATDIVFIRELIAAHPTLSRRALSAKLCEAWDWRQPNGVLRDMVARGLMLMLHRADHIELPPPRQTSVNPLAKRRKPVITDLDIDPTPIECPLSAIQPLEFRLVRRTKLEPLFGGLIEKYHYLGYTQPVGAHLKYMVFANERPVACLAWCSAPRHLGPRDRYIGWSPEARRANIRFVAYNTRYLIMPWVRVPHLASHILGRMVRQLPRDWQEIYGHPLYFLETFIDPALYKGTCYRAANWVPLGLTTGRGKADQTHRANRPLKEVLGYSLARRFREKMAEL